MDEYQFTVRTALMPLYYKDFHCIMGACQDNCCDDGWKIEFSKKDYLKIKRVPKSPELEEMMCQSVSRLRDRAHDDKYAEIKVSGAGRCAFHTKEGLCALQLECGEETLPHVCRSFPRRKHITPAAVEYALSPACEGVLALLWSLPDGIDFCEDPLPAKEWMYVTTSNAVYARFADIRALCIDALQERSLGFPQRLLLLGLMMQQLRDMDWNSEETVDVWLDRAGRLFHDPSVTEELKRLPRNRELFLNHSLGRMLEMGTGASAPLVDELLAAPMDYQKIGAALKPTFNGPRYQELEDKLEELLGHSEYFFENLMVSVAFYWGFPFLGTPEKLWDSYLRLCDLYSCYRFAAVCGCSKEVSRERLFHVLVRISRGYMHSKNLLDNASESRRQDGTDTLAHMAILVGG